MINGSVLAPFIHDSTWPDEVLAKFRPAVYRLYVPVPSLDPVLFLRELASNQLRKENPRHSDEWGCLRTACNTAAHLAVKGIDDGEERFNFAKNLLVFANLLLIGEYGLETSCSVKHEGESEEDRQDVRQRFLGYIDDAYESLRSAVDAIEQNGRRRRGRIHRTHSGSLDLTNAAVASSIPTPIHIVDDEGEDSEIHLVVHFKKMESCRYAFREHDPIGWEMVEGSLQEDRFRDDPMSSPGVWGKS